MFETMSDDELAIHVINNWKLTPCLLIGSSIVNAFKRNFKGTIERAYNVDGVRKLVEEYYGVERVNSGILSIEGIGYLSSAGQNALLKFVEESELPIVLLSYQDKVLNTIRSRMKFTEKRWTPVKSLKFLGVEECQNLMTEKAGKDKYFKGDAVIQFLADNCPELYSLRTHAGDPYNPMNKKVENILSINVNK